MRKNILFTVIIITLNVMNTFSQNRPSKWGDQGNGTYINPILNSDYSDPDVIRVDNKFYMVASDFHFMGMQVLESEDMVNWKLISKIYDRLDFPGWNENKNYAGGSWAPAIRYHDKKYRVYFCTPKEGLFMSQAEKPEGPWTPLHHVKNVEKWEDPCPFWDEDGKAYLVRSRHGAGPIILHRMSDDGKTLLDEGTTVYTGPVAEGPKMMKKDGYYYISIPEGGVESGWQTILRSKDIYGPYESKVVLEQGSTNINGPHQGSLVDTPDGDWYFYHFQQNSSLGRVVHLQPMHWEDNWPVIGVDFDRNGIGEPVYSWKKPIESSAFYTPMSSDDFSNTALSLQWQFNHNPVDEAWEICSSRKVLVLNALKSSSFRLAPNTLTQKIIGYESEATTALELNDLKEGQRCGLACMGKENMLLGVKKENGEKILYISNDTVETNVSTVNSNVVYLRTGIDINKKTFRFAWSEDNINYNECGEPFFIRFGYWKGARVALYNYNIAEAGGKAVFRWFDYKHDGPMQKEESESEKIVSRIARTLFPEKDYIVTKTDNDARTMIQQKIDECSAVGGGRVVIKEGLYEINGNIVLKSDVNLHLEENAYLKFSGKAKDFLPVVQTRWEGTELFGYSPMIYAYHAENIAITGKGTIDGQGGIEFAAWAEQEIPDRDRLREMGEVGTPLYERVFGEGTLLRPSFIQMLGSSRILIEDVTLKNSPFWTIHPVYCDNVIVRGVTIESNYPNNDGCDPESTSNVLIENCTFRTGDDAIAIKAGRDADGRNIGRPSKNIVIRDCLFYSECNGLCIGSEMSGGVENVYMDNIKIGTVKNAIYFKSNRDRGGFIRNVRINNIDVERSKGAILRFETNYFGFRGGKHSSLYEDFMITNVRGESSDNYAVFIDGYEEEPIKDIHIENFHVEKAVFPYYIKHGDNIKLKDTTINNEVVPESPKESKKRKTLDVY